MSDGNQRHIFVKMNKQLINYNYYLLTFIKKCEK